MEPEKITGKLEIEHKMIIKVPDKNDIEQNAKREVPITQTYLNRIDPEIERRVRLNIFDARVRYRYTEKSHVSFGTRREDEKEITVSEYKELIKQKDERLRVLEKTRYIVFHNNKTIEIDIYKGIEEYAILEIETDDINEELILPDWITVIKDVTGDKRFSNYSLAEISLEDAKNILKTLQ